MNLYYRRPAAELIFVTRSMHWKLHREIRSKGGGSEAAKEAVKERLSIPIIQLTKDGEFVKEWPSAQEVYRRLGISPSYICHCLKGRYK